MTAEANAPPSVSMSWINIVLSAAERVGISRAQLLACAGLNLQQLAEERWPIDHITRLWRAAAKLTQDPEFGLKAGYQAGPASFNVVSFIFQSSRSLREAMGLLQKFQRLISDGGRFQIVDSGAKSWVIYHPRQGELAFSPHQIEAVLSALTSFSRWISNSPFIPAQVQFSHSQLGTMAGYQKIFQTSVSFNQAFCGLELDNTLLDSALPQADAQLAAMHRDYAETRLEALSELTDFIGQVQQWLSMQLVHGVPERSSAAQNFALSDRVFARRLEKHGLNYSQLVDKVRRELACEAVAHSARAFSDIAQSLGFSEASAFNRAFKRWVGHSPGEWRLQYTAT